MYLIATKMNEKETLRTITSICILKIHMKVLHDLTKDERKCKEK